ncbi:MAG: hypothetical protein JWQ44_1413 [Chthoniobacter sp.]|nr:hypothetical protein [Chthoniobacter sp.]
MPLVHEPGLPPPELPREFIDDQIHGGVEVGSGFFRVNVRARNGEMNFHRVATRRFRRVIVHQDHVRADDVLSQCLELEDFFGGLLVDRRGKPQMTGAEMDLHDNGTVHPPVLDGKPIGERRYSPEYSRG